MIHVRYGMLYDIILFPYARFVCVSICLSVGCFLIALSVLQRTLAMLSLSQQAKTSLANALRTFQSVCSRARSRYGIHRVRLFGVQRCVWLAATLNCFAMKHFRTICYLDFGREREKEMFWLCFALPIFSTLSLCLSLSLSLVQFHSFYLLLLTIFSLQCLAWARVHMATSKNSHTLGCLGCMHVRDRRYTVHQHQTQCSKGESLNAGHTQKSICSICFFFMIVAILRFFFFLFFCLVVVFSSLSVFRYISCHYC